VDSVDARWRAGVPVSPMGGTQGRGREDPRPTD
jgi:hypothetical protein